MGCCYYKYIEVHGKHSFGKNPREKGTDSHPSINAYTMAKNDEYEDAEDAVFNYGKICHKGKRSEENM